MRFPEPLRLPLGAALVTIAMLGAPVARADGGASGPSGDFPVTVGEPYKVGDTSYTPANSMNYDAVGHVSVGEGAGVTAAHHTLPLPSYVEVTALDTGKTVLDKDAAADDKFLTGINFYVQGVDGQVPGGDKK